MGDLHTPIRHPRLDECIPRYRRSSGLVGKLWNCLEASAMAKPASMIELRGKNLIVSDEKGRCDPCTHFALPFAIIQRFSPGCEALSMQNKGSCLSSPLAGKGLQGFRSSTNCPAWPASSMGEFICSSPSGEIRKFMLHPSLSGSQCSLRELPHQSRFVCWGLSNIVEAMSSQSLDSLLQMSF
jgi:hypothetical protein